MALIEIGSINSFAVAANERAMKQKPFLKVIRSFSELKEVSSNIPPDSFELIKSKDQRGVGLKSIQLTEGFEGFLHKFSNKANEIYFFAWAWDMSGKPVNLYPGSIIDSKEVFIKIKKGSLREFIGEGIDLFPKREVKGGIAIRIQLWESDQKQRDFGKAMSDTADAINKSSLNHLLSAISLATGVSGTAITLIKDASIQLANLVGTILKANGDDYVDFFEGYYASDSDWTEGNDTYNGNSSILTLNKF
jgi:hypothetical protein